MRKKATSIPVNPIDEFGEGIFIAKASLVDLHTYDGLDQSHRHDYHMFLLQEKGTICMEIDFQEHEIKPSSVMYIHPSQVHRMRGGIENITASGWAIDNENLNPEYLKLLEDIAPARPLSLTGEAFSIVSDAVSLCIRLSERKHERLYRSLLKDSCNALVALVISQYLEQYKSADKLSRFEMITRAFRAILERNFINAKKPAEYAQSLNISTSYLNECVKNTSGYSVSHHIQQRVVLEAKRLLYHSDKSVKEIAFELGYADYPYFSRLFAKATGMSALAFRRKNRE